mmetsp:Transcript_2836/g.6642  ORF Transcript_2836/g.6642 Transcript_2836/m.6642 type:complete len:381 (+) Transcript_2836:1677-2819(+)
MPLADEDVETVAFGCPPGTAGDVHPAPNLYCDSGLSTISEGQLTRKAIFAELIALQCGLPQHVVRVEYTTLVLVPDLQDNGLVLHAVHLEGLIPCWVECVKIHFSLTHGASVCHDDERVRLAEPILVLQAVRFHDRHLKLTADVLSKRRPVEERSVSPSAVAVFGRYPGTRLHVSQVLPCSSKGPTLPGECHDLSGLVVVGALHLSPRSDHPLRAVSGREEKLVKVLSIKPPAEGGFTRRVKRELPIFLTAEQVVLCRMQHVRRGNASNQPPSSSINAVGWVIGAADDGDGKCGVLQSAFERQLAGKATRMKRVALKRGRAKRVICIENSTLVLVPHLERNWITNCTLHFKHSVPHWVVAVPDHVRFKPGVANLDNGEWI